MVGSPSDVKGLAFSPNGTQLLSWFGQACHVWDVETGAILHKFEGYPGAGHPSFSPHGRLLVWLADANTVSLWDLESGAQHSALKLDNRVTGTAFSSDGKLLATITNTGALSMWEVQSLPTSLTLVESSDSVTDLSFSPDGSVLVSGSKNGALRL